METDLHQSTSLKSGTKAQHHLQNMLGVTLLCAAQLIPFGQTEMEEMSREPDITCKSSAATKKKKKNPSHLTFLITELTLLKKMGPFVTVKNRDMREEALRCVQEEEKNMKTRPLVSPSPHRKDESYWSPSSPQEQMKLSINLTIPRRGRKEPEAQWAELRQRKTRRRIQADCLRLDRRMHLIYISVVSILFL